MFLTFREFVNRRDEQRGFRKQLMSKLGNLADDTIPIRAFRKGEVEKAILSCDGIDEEKKNDLVAFAKEHPASRILDLIHQFGGSQGDLSMSDGEIAGEPAELPEGQPKPKKKKQPPPDQGGDDQGGPGGPPPGGPPPGMGQPPMGGPGMM